MKERQQPTSLAVKILIAVIPLVIGFLLGFFFGKNTNQSLRSFSEVADEISVDSLQEIRDTANAFLFRKDSSAFDSLKKLSMVRDSLVEVNGRITTAMIAVVKEPAAYDSLDALRFQVNLLVSSCDSIIMKGALDMLRPTNESLKALVKDIKTKTEQLQNIAKRVAVISDIVNAITTILSAPILAPVSATPAT